MKTIYFPKAQTAAILHRMDCGDCLAEVFADSDHLMHMAEAVEARALALSTELTATGCVTIDPASELDAALMLEVIEGSTWIAVHSSDEVSSQARTAAERSLKGAAFLIQTAFGLPDNSIEVPPGMTTRQHADIAGLDPRSETLENVAAAVAIGIMLAVCIVAGLSS